MTTLTDRSHAVLKSIAHSLSGGGTVAVCSHVRPDGDAIGSTLGLTLALRSIGVDAVPTLAGPSAEPPETYAFLPGFDLFRPARELFAPDVFVALDTPIPDRLGDAQDLMLSAPEVVVIDHHPDAVEYGLHHLLDASAAATSEIVWGLLPHLGVVPDAQIATPLYAALITDTGRFSYDNTSPSALRTAAEMMEAGVDAAFVARMVYQERTPASLALEARALSRLTLANGGTLVWTYVDDTDFAETQARPEDAEHLADAIRSLGGVRIALLCRVAGDEVRANLRSKDGSDIGSVARVLGGGGHRAAAGVTWKGTLPSFLDTALPMLPGAPRA